MSGAESGQGSPAMVPGGQVAPVALERFLRPLAISVMLSCLAISMAQAARLLWPQAPVTLGAGLAFLVSLESIWAHRLLARRGVGNEDRLRFRFVEWVVLLLLARFGPYLHLGGLRLAADLDLWALQPGAFLALEFVGLAALMACFWWAALYLARNLDELEAAPWEERASTLSADFYLRSTMPQHGMTNRQAVLDRITTVYYVGGALLLLFAGVARLQVVDGLPRRPSVGSGIVLNALVYFVLGLLLISQAQYTIQRARWQIERVPVLDQIGRRWFVTVLVLLLVLALVSALLPTGYSVGLLEALSTALFWLAYGIAQLFYIILVLFGLFVSWLASLLGIELGPAGALSQRMPPPMPPEVADGAGAPAWWAILRSVLFWGLLIAIAAYALLAFVRERWGLLQGFSLGRWLGTLLDLWRGLRGGVRAVWRAWGRSLGAGIRRLLGPRATASAWLRPRLARLPPREKIRYYYLSVLHRAALQGLARAPAETPLEYRTRLAQALPEADALVDALTEAFVEARYSAHTLSDAHARGVGQVWRTVRRALQQRRRSLAARDGDGKA